MRAVVSAAEVPKLLAQQANKTSKLGKCQERKYSFLFIFRAKQKVQCHAYRFRERIEVTVITDGQLFFSFFQPDGRKQECVFVEEFLENNYTALVSAKYKGWYLGFNRKGRPKKGSQTTQRQQEVHFMKRQPKGRLDPLEEFRFTTVTKRTRRARRLKPNSKRNWWDQWDSTNFPRGGGGVGRAASANLFLS